jgi:hypothetical protein
MDLDHQAFLDITLAQIALTQIARHKAGIARPGRPFVLGPQNDDPIGSRGSRPPRWWDSSTLPLRPRRQRKLLRCVWAPPSSITCPRDTRMLLYHYKETMKSITLAHL